MNVSPVENVRRPTVTLQRSAASLLLALSLPIVGCGRAVLDAEKPGEMVMYSETGRLRGFDPIKAGDVPSALAIARIYEGLLQYSYLDRPYRVEPCLAEALPEVSADGLTYTFRVRPGIYFQDDPCFTRTGGKGRELVAEDFVYSIKRCADIKNASSGYWAYNDRIVGLDTWRERSGGLEPTDYDAPVEGLSAPDRYTFRIVLTRPYPQLLWILTMHYGCAVAREAVEHYGTDFVNHPVGTGAYILNAYRHNYRVEFVRNPKWAETGRVERYPASGTPEDEAAGLLADAGRPIPFIDRVVQYVVDDDVTQWLMFLRGQFESSGISRDNWDVVIRDFQFLTPELEEKGITLRKTPTLDLFYIGFNLDDPVVGKNKKLRQALSCAFNTEAWVKFLNNRVTRPTGPIPPGVAGYTDRPSPFGFNLEKARVLLAEAGYPEGQDPKTGRRLELTLEVGSADSAESRAQLEIIGDFMSQIGVVLKASYNNWPTFLEKMERRQCQLYSLGWVADYPDAENFLQLFYGPNASPGPNHSNYVNPEFDRLYETVRVMQDSPERTALYEKMSDLIIEDCPWIFQSIPLAFGLQHQWIRNYKYHDFPYGMQKYYRIDTEARRQWKLKYSK